MHYASHRVGFLWRLHAVHHSVKRMYGFNGLMKHPLHLGCEALAGTLPLLLLGMPEQVAALLALAITLQLLLQHSNVDMRLGALRHLFAWAPVHRFHHMKYGRAGDVNFALFLSIWDRLLGTAFHSDYPMRGDDLGIGSRPDYPDAYLAQLAEPFRESTGEHPHRRRHGVDAFVGRRTPRRSLYKGSAAACQNGRMNSPLHRCNLLQWSPPAICFVPYRSDLP